MPTTSDAPAIAIEAVELTKTYGKGVRALDGLSFSAAGGHRLRACSDRTAPASRRRSRSSPRSAGPTAARARVAGIDVLADPAACAARSASSAQRASFDRDATGRENLVLQGQIYDVTGAALKSRVDALLERFGLAGAADRAAKTYSGGMQRRLDIALGLLHEPEVLFLDEPTTGLDPEARAEMWDEIGGSRARSR